MGKRRLVYISKCSEKERMSIAWWRLGIRRLKRIRKNFQKGKCPISNGREDAQHIILECEVTKELRRKYLNSRILNIHPNLAYNKIIYKKSNININNIGKLLYKIKMEWEKKILEI